MGAVEINSKSQVRNLCLILRSWPEAANSKSQLPLLSPGETGDTRVCLSWRQNVHEVRCFTGILSYDLFIRTWLIISWTSINTHTHTHKRTHAYTQKSEGLMKFIWFESIIKLSNTVIKSWHPFMGTWSLLCRLSSLVSAVTGLDNLFLG